jgi:hypothetical protein
MKLHTLGHIISVTPEQVIYAYYPIALSQESICQV